MKTLLFMIVPADCSITKSITIEKGVNDEIQLYLMVRPSIIRLVGVGG